MRQDGNAARIVDLGAGAVQTPRDEGAHLNDSRATSREDVEQPAHGAVQVTRTAQSVIAERAAAEHRAKPLDARALAKAREVLASAFDTVMHEHWVRGELAYSNCAVARACGVDVKTVRQWRTVGKGGKPIPWACELLLPGRLREQLQSEIARLRGHPPRRAVAMLKEGAAGLRKEIAHEDRHEVRRVISEVQLELFKLAQEVA